MGADDPKAIGQALRDAILEGRRLRQAATLRTVARLLMRGFPAGLAGQVAELGADAARFSMVLVDGGLATPAEAARAVLPPVNATDYFPGDT